MVVDHDIYMIYMLSDRLLMFEGKPMARGEVHGPFDMRQGMNRLLKSIGITFRRDDETKRPRVNKLDCNWTGGRRLRGSIIMVQVKTYFSEYTPS